MYGTGKRTKFGYKLDRSLRLQLYSIFLFDVNLEKFTIN